MIILGIDPGVATIGFGVIRADRQKNTLLRYGVITTPPGIPLSHRLLQIAGDMEELIHTFHPDEMAVEELFFTKNITTGIAVAHGRGVILLAAEKLGVSRQTISKWELDETLPDINQSKKLAVFYRLTLDQLISFDVEAAELEQVIENTSQEVREKIDWTQLWAKQYPVLAQYQERVDLPSYTGPLAALLDRLRQEQGYNEQDAFLVLKDILGQMWTKGAAR